MASDMKKDEKKDAFPAGSDTGKDAMKKPDEMKK
jgi:hypothetical protein